jgi:hypothetical protein
MSSQLPVPASGDPWSRFLLDPRMPANAGLRAADADRDLIHQLLVTAYAEGRLDRTELDERTDGVARAKTLGELPVFVTDLLPATSRSLMAPEPDLVAQATERWRRARREAAWGFLSASLICWVIWALTGADGLPWPVFVMLGTGLNVLRTMVNRSDMVADEVRRLEKKQRKQLPPGGSA